VVAVFIILICLFIYFLPSLIGKSKRNAGAIFALNLLLGWTLIGWVVSLVWALTVEPEYQVQQAWNCSVCRAPLRQNDRFCAACGTTINWIRS
jgi:TM2 domain-containing membrane protein YozV